MEISKQQLMQIFYDDRYHYRSITNKFHYDFDEIVQDCCLKILSARRDVYIFQHKNQVFDFLWRVVHHICINMYRMEKELLYTFVDIPEETPDIPIDYENKGIFQYITNHPQLTTLQKTIIQKHYWEHLKYKDLSEQLYIHPTTLRAQFFRAKEKLQRSGFLKQLIIQED